METDFCMADDEMRPVLTHFFKLEQSRFFFFFFSCAVVVVMGSCDSPNLEKKKRSCVSAHMESHTK